MEITCKKNVQIKCLSRQFARCILGQPLLSEPHDHQVERIFAVMDFCDLVAIRATGTDKFGFFLMLMLVMRAISKDNALALGGRIFPKDHGIILPAMKKHFKRI